MNKVFHIVRGLPGSGCTTKAMDLCNPINLDNKGDFGLKIIVEVDSYFLVNHQYRFDMRYNEDAQRYAFFQLDQRMKQGMPTLILVGIFSQLYQMDVYKQLAQSYGYEVVVHNTPETDVDLCFDRTHKSISKHIIQKLKDQWQ